MSIGSSFVIFCSCSLGFLAWLVGEAGSASMFVSFIWLSMVDGLKKAYYSRVLILVALTYTNQSVLLGSTLLVIAKEEGSVG